MNAVANNNFLLGFLTALGNFSQSYPFIYHLLDVVLYVVGACFVLYACYLFKKVADSHGRDSYVPVIVTGVVGVLMIFTPQVIATVEQTMFTSAALNPMMDYNTPTTGVAAGLMKPVILTLQLLGYFAYARGLFIGRHIGSPQAREGVVGRALFHVFGGVALIHIVDTSTIIASAAQMDISWLFN